MRVRGLDERSLDFAISAQSRCRRRRVAKDRTFDPKFDPQNLFLSFIRSVHPNMGASDTSNSSDDVHPTPLLARFEVGRIGAREPFLDPDVQNLMLSKAQLSL